MNEDMNRFTFNTEGKICDYCEEEPKVLTDLEILEELNHLENTKNEFMGECQAVNWTNECLQEQLAEKEKEIDKLEEKLQSYYEETLNQGTCGLCEHLRGEYKTDFAIEQLNKVIDILDKNYWDVPYEDWSKAMAKTQTEIANLIKELKEKK